MGLGPKGLGLAHGLKPGLDCGGGGGGGGPGGGGLQDSRTAGGPSHGGGGGRVALSTDAYRQLDGGNEVVVAWPRFESVRNY